MNVQDILSESMESIQNHIDSLEQENRKLKEIVSVLSQLNNVISRREVLLTLTKEFGPDLGYEIQNSVSRIYTDPTFADKIRSFIKDDQMINAVKLIKVTQEIDLMRAKRTFDIFKTMEELTAEKNRG